MPTKLPQLAVFITGLILGVTMGLWLLQHMPSDSTPFAIAFAVALAALMILIILLRRD